jgi:hypothetical protein
MKSLVEQRQHQHQSPVTVTAEQLPNQILNHQNNIMATTTKVILLLCRPSLRFVSQLWLLLLLLWFLMMYVHEEDGGHSRCDDTWTMTSGTVTTVSAFSSMAQPPPLRIRTTFPRVTTLTHHQQQQQHWYKLPQLQLQQHHPKPQHRFNAAAKGDTNGDATDRNGNTNMATTTGEAAPPIFQQTDPIIRNAAKILQRTSWISWWCQVILTVISSVILLFAKSNSNNSISGGGGSSNFVLSTLGLVCSTISILWTWGNGTRLSRRFLIRPISRHQVQNMIRRAIQVGITLNCMGLLCHLLAAQQIIGLLAVKVLTNRSGGGGLLLAAALDGSSHTLQPLDILIVQANTNALLSQYLSLVLLLSLMVRILPTLPEPVIVTTTTTTDF